MNGSVTGAYVYKVYVVNKNNTKLYTYIHKSSKARMIPIQSSMRVKETN